MSEEISGEKVPQPHEILNLPKEDEIVELALNRPMTLRNVERERIKLVELAIHMLKHGTGIAQTARACKLSKGIIRAIRDKYSKQIGDLRGEGAKDWRMIQKMTAERIMELLDDDDKELTINQLGVIGGIATEKAELLEGNATQRVEKVEKETFADMDEIFKKMKKAQIPNDDVHDV